VDRRCPHRLPFSCLLEPQLNIQEKAGEIKRELGNRVRQQLRRIPEVKYFRDDTLDQVFRMEEIFKKISEEKKPDNDE